MSEGNVAGRNPASIERAFSFGPFCLFPSQQLLLEDGSPVRLGGRALQILTALLGSPGEIISKRELIDCAWPNTIVEEVSFRSQMAALRRALGDGQPGRRYITNVPGQGYCFVAPVSQSGERPVTVAFPVPDSQFLPARSVGMVGRDDGVRTLAEQLATSRFVTIVGPGGVGKTTVAIAVAHQLLESFAGAVLFVDLGLLSDPHMMAGSLASMLDISVEADDPTPGLIAYLRDKRILLILDNCEHLIEAAANLAASIFRAASQLHILATSREPLRADGEHIHRLAPLAFPSEQLSLTAAVALTFPAIQLFLERAEAGGASLDLGDTNVAIVADICRKLDGMALAIELAAGRVATYGLQQTAALLDRRLALLWQGRRTAPSRQKSLQATLDWSYELLSDQERAVLRGLAEFVGTFTIDAALAVVASATVDHARVFGAIDSLIGKSMVATRPFGPMMHYRLLDTTRAYVLEISIAGDERTDLAVRHATYYRQWLEDDGAKWPTLSNAVERASHLANFGNVRAALEWCFSADGSSEIGTGLVCAAAPVFLAMSLLAECERWSERALLAMSDATRGGAEEMHLQAALATSLMFTRGESEAARVAIDRSLAIAEDRGDVSEQLRLLGLLHMFHYQVGNLKTALHYAKRGAIVASTTEDPVAIAGAHTVLGITYHFIGDLDNARSETEAALDNGVVAQPTSATSLGFGHHLWAGANLARTLWLQGYPDQAAERARQTVEHLASAELPILLSTALALAVSVFLWTGDFRTAEEYADSIVSLAKTHSLGASLTIGCGFKGELAIHLGDTKVGVEGLRACVEKLRSAHFELPIAPFEIALAQGLVATGQFAEGVTLIDATLRRVEAHGNLAHVPELLRVKGIILLLMRQAHDVAETYFVQSLELSRSQGALSWELRTTTSLAELWYKEGRVDEALGLLGPVYGRFTEGFATADLMTAKCLLDELVSSKPMTPVH